MGLNSGQIIVVRIRSLKVAKKGQKRLIDGEDQDLDVALWVLADSSL